MSNAMIFKCPCCGGYLEFEASLQKFKCLYCGQVLSEDDLREQSEQRQAEADAVQQEEQSASSDSLRSYHCTMCGAEIVTSATTAATRCYFCHSPVVLHDRLDDEFRPDGVIPFKLDQQAAKKAFKEFLSRKKFVDRAFFSDDQLEMLTGVYYPYWFCDIAGEGEFDGEGTRTSVMTTAQHYITTTKFFRVQRKGRLTFRNMARKALASIEGKLSDGIHPFRLDEIKPYASGYLSGFLAEKRDVDEETVKADMLREAQGYAEGLMQSNHTFGSLRGNAGFRADKVEVRYYLLPVWVLTWKGGKDGAPYYYLMNGQTGQVCGRLPISKAKLWGTAAVVALIVFALLCGGGAFLW